MSKLHEKAEELFDQNSSTTLAVGVFENNANFRQLFVVQSLSEEEETSIRTLLRENTIETNKHPNALEDQDYVVISDFTRQIRAIDRQGVLLHGERIAKVRDILKNYREGSFTKWLLITYGNRQTPYRMLHFYELFQKLAIEDRNLLEKMPKRVAYAIATRTGSLDKKIEIIRGNYRSTANEIFSLIQSSFPLPCPDRRRCKKRLEDLLSYIECSIVRLKKIGESLDSMQVSRLSSIVKSIEEILKDKT